MLKNIRLLVPLFFLAEIPFGGFLLLPIWTLQTDHRVSFLGRSSIWPDSFEHCQYHVSLVFSHFGQLHVPAGATDLWFQELITFKDVTADVT